jgi:uncharacterized membrane protein
MTTMVWPRRERFATERCNFVRYATSRQLHRTVVALDQLHRLLRVVGRRHLHDDVIMDSSGKPRVIFRTPGWDDFVQLSCREIRLYGAENYQVARRLRAMLENLVQSLFEARHAA